MAGFVGISTDKKLLVNLEGKAIFFD